TGTESLHYDLMLRNANLKVSLLCPLWVKTRLAQAERNRPAGNTADTVAPDRLTASVGQAIVDAVEKGIAVEKVADAVFDAILTNRFYILTELNKVMPMLQTRMTDLLKQRQPTFFPLK